MDEMKSKLRIEIKGKQENDHHHHEVLEPVSPTGQYLNSECLKLYILAIMELEVLLDESCAIPQLRDIFLPLNHRFSSIMITDKEGARQWKRVEVNLHDHVNIPSLPKGLSIESYDDYFSEYLTKIAKEHLPQDRPLWELHIFNYPTSKAPGHIIMKFHHSLGDGYSLMGALLSCATRVDDPSLPLAFPSTRGTSEVKRSNDVMSYMTFVPRTISSVCKGLYDFGWSFVKSTYIADDKSPIRSANEGVSSKPMEISSIEFSLDQVKLIKTKLGSTLNDTVTGIVFLGARLYMQATQTENNKTQSTALVLLNTRNMRDYMSVEEMVNTTHTKVWGNQFSFLHITMPELIKGEHSNPLHFVYEAQRQVTRYKTSPAVYLNAHCLEIMRKIKDSEAIAKHVYSTMEKSSIGITNMIGPVQKVALAGHPIKGMYFMVSGSPVSLVATIMSYVQTLRIGLGVEKSFIDMQRLQSCMHNAFELIYEAATKIE